MPSMGRYCKAYYVEQFEQYPHWAEMANVNRVDEAALDRGEILAQLDKANYLFLQENFVVTGSIFKDQDIVFDVVTQEWKDFCEKTLCFEIPTCEEVEQSAENGRQHNT